MANVEEVHGEVRHRGARRRRGLGGRAPEGGGRRQHRRRSRHHPVDERRRATCTRTSCVDVTDVANYLGKKYGGWYPVCQQYLQAGRQEVDRRAAGLRRQRARLPRERAEGGRLRQRPEGHRRLPQAVPGAEGEGHARRASRSATPPATATPGRTGSSGRTAASWSTRRTRSSSTARRRSRALEYAKRALRDVRSRARCRGSTRTTTRRSSTASSASPPTASRSTTRRRTSTGPEGARRWPRTSTTRTSRSGPIGRPTRVQPVLQPDDLQVHEVPEGGEGVPALHDGEGAGRARGCRRRSAT